jgi:YHS domain-containing protein
MGYIIRFLLLGLLFVLIARSFWKFVGSIVEGASSAPRKTSGTPDRGLAMARDPVCGTFVVPSRALAITEGTRAIYFCSERCRQAYRADSTRRAGQSR